MKRKLANLANFGGNLANFGGNVANFGDFLLAEISWQVNLGYFG